MTPFQWLACAGLGAAVLREIVVFRRHAASRSIAAVRALVWAAALGAILDPLLVTRFANAIGIGRGADVVLYLFVVFALAAGFWLHARQVRLQRQITALTRHIALADPKRGPQ